MSTQMLTGSIIFWQSGSVVKWTRGSLGNGAQGQFTLVFPLKLVHVKKKRTCKWLAEQLGKNASTVRMWCTNTSQPDLQTLDQIAALLECDRKYLIND